MELSKSYDPQSVEEATYNFWIEKNLFHSKPDENKKPFTIVIPPPNVTGSLHMGHALNNTLQDAIIRYKRLCGFNTCWVPGMDHGGIATENVVEKILLEEGRFAKNKNELGREKFLERMWEWEKESGGAILNQLKKLGCALDWERTRFTMDEICSRSVNVAFVQLYNKGLIYRGKRLVNWCPRCMTALSDIEVEHKEEIGSLWHIKYPLKSSELEVRSSENEIQSQEKLPIPNCQLPTYIVVATTRPETMLGDTAVAVNPKDERYKRFIGKKLILPLVEREIPIIADDAVDMTFGTGAVKVTPAHDPNDFEIGQRHNLEKVVVIDFSGKMTGNAGPRYAGLDRYHARKEILQELEEKGLLMETADHPHSIGVCYRCNTTIEPLISEQWFLSVSEMSKRAADAASDGELQFHPESWKKPYIVWLENLRDWCISRQIWWGHRIPVWYCSNKETVSRDTEQQSNRAAEQRTRAGDGRRETGDGFCLPPSTIYHLPSTKSKCPPIVSVEKPEKCPECGNVELVQDEDVLDTWFSSALWPFSVFGWPERQIQDTSNNQMQDARCKMQTETQILPVSRIRHPVSDLSYYYPTSVLVTGHEILYLWVARMVQMGLTFLNEIPFKDVYIHGIVRDKFGKKMSKSLGNVIDPLDIMKKYGTDALRFSMISSATAGRDIQLSEDSFVGARNFANKLYNASRFIVLNLQNCPLENLELTDDEMEQTDRWILSQLNKIISETAAHYDEYELDKVARTAYEFTWTKFCDWYIEFSKERLYGSDKKSQSAAMKVLLRVLVDILKILHPIMPFITEMLWQNLRSNLSGDIGKKWLNESIMSSEYPCKIALSKEYDQSSQNINALIEFISKVRSVREEMRVPASKYITLNVRGDEKIKLDIIAHNVSHIKKLARVENIIDLDKNPSGSAYGVAVGLEFFIPLEGLIDIEKERERLKLDMEKLVKFRDGLQKKLQNKNFIEKAPTEEVENTKNKLKETVDKIEKLQQNLRYISCNIRKV